MKAVIVLVADEKYKPHARSLLVNCKRQGRWQGDFALVLPPGPDAQDYRARGIHVFEDGEPKYYKKYAIFDDFFRKWDIVGYLDCDMLVVDDLAPVLDQMEWGKILGDREPFDLMHCFSFWSKPNVLHDDKALETFRWLWKRYDPEYHQFCTATMFYYTRDIPTTTRRDLCEMTERIRPINTHVVNGTEQPCINLLFYNKFVRVHDRVFCYYEFENQRTRLIHTCSGYAPWIRKTNIMSGYDSVKLGRPMYDVYVENLNAFDQEFPVKR
jgi:hypothetical protein